MKISKAIIVMAAVLVMSMTACGNKVSPAQQAIDLTESVTKQVEQAKDLVELNNIQQDFQKKFESLENPKDYTPTAEEESKLQTVMQNYLQAYITKMNELADSSNPMSSSADDQDAAQSSAIDEGITEASEE